ncbi:phage portal protein [Citrobacter freundii]|nr:phage portal protein [Citrobacter freundii]
MVGSIPSQRRKARFWGWMLDCPRLKLSALKNVGEDWEDLLDQRQREIQALKERGLPLPPWAISEDAEDTIKEPEEK